MGRSRITKADNSFVKSDVLVKSHQIIYSDAFYARGLCFVMGVVKDLGVVLLKWMGRTRECDYLETF